MRRRELRSVSEGLPSTGDQTKQHFPTDRGRPRARASLVDLQTVSRPDRHRRIVLPCISTDQARSALPVWPSESTLNFVADLADLGTSAFVRPTAP